MNKMSHVIDDFSNVIDEYFAAETDDKIVYKIMKFFDLEPVLQ